MISEVHLTSVCRLGAGRECCRYLLNGAGKWVCGKHTDLAAYIDQRVTAGTFNAIGDNCDGLVADHARSP